MINLTQKQVDKLDSWVKEQAKIALERQKETVKNPSYGFISSWEMGYPYEGAIGGSLTYHVTPTSMGVIIKASHSMTDNEIDLTEYEDW